MSEVVTIGKRAKPDTFAEGSVVYLKSGGPIMTVRSLTTVSKNVVKVDVDWFTDGEPMSRDYFSYQLTDRKPEVDKSDAE